MTLWSEQPTIPDRSRFDADLAPAFRSLAAMYAPQDRRTILHLERLIAGLRRKNDELANELRQEREAREGIETALLDRADELAAQDGEIVYLRAVVIALTEERDTLIVALQRRGITGWEI